MKKIAASVLTILVAIPLLFTGFMLAKQKLLHFTREERIKKAQLETITLSAEKVVWLKRGKEMLITGKPFDVKRWVQRKDKIVVTGFFDTEETDIYERLTQTYSEQGQKPFPFASLVHFLQTPMHDAGISFLLPAPGWRILQLSYGPCDEKIACTPSPEIDHPPISAML